MVMHFGTLEYCPDCKAHILVYPAYTTIAKINQRSLPAFKRCECIPRFHEISTAEFEALVPNYKELMDQGDRNEKMED